METKSIDQILENSAHRSWQIPTKKWSFYQEWNKAIFLHWEFDAELISNLIPKNLELDTFNGKAWISLVAFTMEKIRPRLLLSFPPISNFHEINLRTYVKKDNKPGVYFLNIEAEKWLSAFIAKSISGLPYEKSQIVHDLNSKIYKAHFDKKNFNLEIQYKIEQPIVNKTALDEFLTERYCLYLEQNNQLIRYEIQHLPWALNTIKIEKLTTNYQINQHVSLNTKPILMHYSNGIQVIAWNKEHI